MNKYGICESKHLESDIKKSIREYFLGKGVSGDDLEGLVVEAFNEAKGDSLSACDWAFCNN